MGNSEGRCARAQQTVPDVPQHPLPLPLAGLHCGYTSMFTVSRRYLGSLARLTFSVRVCHTRTWGRDTFWVATLSVRTRRATPHKCNQYLGAVICFRFQFFHSGYLLQKVRFCIPGWDPRRLNTAFGLDKMT